MNWAEVWTPKFTQDCIVFGGMALFFIVWLVPMFSDVMGFKFSSLFTWLPLKFLGTFGAACVFASLGFMFATWWNRFVNYNEQPPIPFAVVVASTVFCFLFAVCSFVRGLPEDM